MDNDSMASASSSQSGRNSENKDTNHTSTSTQLANNLLTNVRKKATGSVMTSLNSVMKKVGVDTKLQFTLEPPTTGAESKGAGYDQWLDAMRSVSRLPDGIPNHFRKKLWLSLATQVVTDMALDWPNVCLMAFSDRVHADDDEMGIQIIKDLHRTGWSGLSGDKERVLLKRVLLAYARFNKQIGYCQGFNVIAALILQVVDYNEQDAFKVMILFLEHVLPTGFFDHTLRALTVDMAVLNELMHQRLPTLAAHLDMLQKNSASIYEPPVTNVFSMQWMLTLYATCLPRWLVLRVWDALLIEGSEVLLRTSLAIWARISKRVGKTKTADQFYSVMGSVCQSLLQLTHSDCNHLMQVVYTMSEFPYPGVAELRERYTWNIQPFSSGLKQIRTQFSSFVAGESEEESDSNQRCLAAALVPAAGKMCASAKSGAKAVDISALQKQYKQLKQRQKQAAVILQTAYSKGQEQVTQLRKGSLTGAVGNHSTATSPTGSQQPQQGAFNHLYLTKNSSNKSDFCTMNGVVPLQSRAIQPMGTQNCRSREQPVANEHREGQHKQSTSTMCVSESTSTMCVSESTSTMCVSESTSTMCVSESTSTMCVSESTSTMCVSESTHTGTWTPRSSICTLTDRYDESDWSFPFGCPLNTTALNHSYPSLIHNKKQIDRCVSNLLLSLDLAVDWRSFKRDSLWLHHNHNKNNYKNSKSLTKQGASNELAHARKESGASKTESHSQRPSVSGARPFTCAPPRHNYNPFPTKHTSRLIEREKKMGLY